MLDACLRLFRQMQKDLLLPYDNVMKKKTDSKLNSSFSEVMIELYCL